MSQTMGSGRETRSSHYTFVGASVFVYKQHITNDFHNEPLFLGVGFTGIKMIASSTGAEGNLFHCVFVSGSPPFAAVPVSSQ